MNENIFKRIEKKYILSKELKDKLFNNIDKYIEKDDYYDSNICNIYFDNNNNDLIINSIEKPTFKAKIRLRSYGVPDKDSKVFLELKNKYNGVVGKRRIKLSLNEFYNYLEDKIFNDEQIMRELNYYFKTFNLKPYVFVAYNRKSYCEKNNKDLRITLDSNLRYRTNDLRLELGDFGKEYFDDDIYIMEIKCLNALPLWLVKCLSEFKIFPTSFSKVGNIYKKLEGEKLKC